MTPNGRTNARDRILYLLKTEGPQTASQLANQLGVTAIAVRQHLQTLETSGEVAREFRKGRVGRPAHVWELTERASACFPDRHGELACSLLQSVEASFGPEGLAKVLDEWTRREVTRCQGALPDGVAGATERLRALVALRREQGFMPELREDENGTFELIENHCPISQVASTCEELCCGELRVFASLLGPELTVRREEHIVAGDRRCVYRITPVDVASDADPDQPRR